MLTMENMSGAAVNGLLACFSVHFAVSVSVRSVLDQTNEIEIVRC